MRTPAALTTTTQQDLVDLTDEELDTLIALVRAEHYRRSDRRLVDEIRAALAADEDLICCEDLGTIVTVVFPTWDWDNGWFLQESGARILDEQGRRQEYDFSDNETITNLLSDASGTFALGPAATMTIDLISGSVDVDTYGEDN